MHINIGNIWHRQQDIKNDDLFPCADVISFNETHLSPSDNFTPSLLGLPNDYVIFRMDRNSSGGGVALVVRNCLEPTHLPTHISTEIVAVQIANPVQMVIISVYRPPTFNMSTFISEMSSLLERYKGLEICIVGDFNEDIFLSQDKPCCAMLLSHGLHQVVKKPTRDSGTLIDHLYVTCASSVKSDVADCYYSDHDFVMAGFIFGNM